MKITATSYILKITPEIATEWLAELWPGQRVQRDSHVARLASDMNADRFRISPDAILRIKGKLANGQHRLLAVVLSGKAQLFLVMESNDEELYKVIDAGLRRNVSDAIRDLPFCKIIPSIARWVRVYESKRLRPASRSASEAGLVDIYPTQVEVIEYCRDNADVLTDAASFTNPLYSKTKLLPLSIGAAIYVLGDAKTGYREKAETFLKEVYLGGNPSAALDLRNRLISNRGSKAKLFSGYVFGITLKAFKSYCNGTRPGTLRWDKGEPVPDVFSASK